VCLILDEHRQYLGDGSRLSAFWQAIREVIKPGAVILDLGTGTGIMGMLACQAGARRVYAIDAGGMIEVARSLCHHNSLQDRVTFIKGHSKHVELPEQVDVVVADQIGRFGFEAGVVEYFADARRRFLKPGGKLIPSQIEMIVAPVEHPEMRAQVDFWDGNVFGLELDVVRRWADNTGYPVKYQPEHLLGEPITAATLDLTVSEPKTFKLTANLTIRRTGVLHGIGGWFVAQLSPGVRLTNSPLSTERINRHNVFFPIERPLAVTEGDLVIVEMTIMPVDVMVAWRVQVLDRARSMKDQFTHSTWQGRLTSREELERTRPDFVPHLSPRGHARQTVLSLTDGKRTLVEIEQELFRRHPQLFHSANDAAAFVAEVITRYAASPYDAISVVQSDS
jgi:protein arginine N-methyltransferase 1